MPNQPQGIREQQISAIDVNDVDGAGVVMPGFVDQIRQDYGCAGVCGEGDAASSGADGVANASTEQREAGYVSLARVLVLRDYCLRPWGSSCSRCEQLCPYQAITFGEDTLPYVDTERCLSCSVCVGVCDAFTLADVNMSELHSRIRTIALQYGEVVLTCAPCVSEKESLAEQVVVLPSLALLSAEFLVNLLAQSTRLTIAGRMEDLFCAACGGQIAERIATSAIRLAEEWSGDKLGYVEQVPERGQADTCGHYEAKSRREYFDELIASLAPGVQEQRDGVLPNETYMLQQRKTSERFMRLSQRQLLSGLEVPRVNVFMAKGRLKQQLWPKRRYLLEACLSRPEIEDRVMLRVSITQKALCNDCLSCVAACPSKARFADPSDGLLEFDARYCIGCGLCEYVCTHEAIQMEIVVPAEITDEAEGGV